MASTASNKPDPTDQSIPRHASTPIQTPNIEDFTTSEFNPAELLTAEALATELVRRAKIQDSLLERLGDAVNNRVYDVFLFLFKYAPATEKQMSAVFSPATLKRALHRLEAAEVIEKHGAKYHIHF